MIFRQTTKLSCLFHFRDKEGLKCDAVVHLRNGSYGLVEIKLGGEKLIKDGVATLVELAGKIDTELPSEAQAATSQSLLFSLRSVNKFRTCSSVYWNARRKGRKTDGNTIFRMGHRASTEENSIFTKQNYQK